jgi:hypothetical protein
MSQVAASGTLTIIQSLTQSRTHALTHLPHRASQTSLQVTFRAHSGTTHLSQRHPAQRRPETPASDNTTAPEQQAKRNQPKVTVSMHHKTALARKAYFTSLYGLNAHKQIIKELKHRTSLFRSSGTRCKNCKDYEVNYTNENQQQIGS